MRVVFFLLMCSAGSAQTKTVLDGIYSPSQAERGRVSYAKSCAGCHKADLTGFSGPPLKGEFFLDRWREFRSNVLYEVIRTSMPKDAEAPLPEATYLDIFAYLLHQNEIPAGTVELKVPVLAATLLVGKNGPQPLPSSAQVGVVGCLTLEVGTGWFVTKAGDPFRALDGFESPLAEIAEAKAAPFGTGLFRLQNVTDLPNVDLKALDGSKVEAKGILVRQQKSERVNVTALKLVSPTCGE